MTLLLAHGQLWSFARSLSENFPTCYLNDSTVVLGGLDANTTTFLEKSGEINPNSIYITPIAHMLIGIYSQIGEYLPSYN